MPEKRLFRFRAGPFQPSLTVSEFLPLKAGGQLWPAT